MSEKILLEMKNITKLFPGVKALDDVNLKVKEGSIHALVGENGAGKSTLMNVLSGIYPYGTYTGDIIYDGEECRFSKIRDSEAKGIVIIHQELALVPYMTIGENMFLGNERGKAFAIDWTDTYVQADKYLKVVGLSESSHTQIKDIGVGKQQLVEIAKALSKNARLLILDEPTSSLDDNEVEKLFGLMRNLKAKGVGIIFVTHFLDQVYEVSDRITVLRDGKLVGEYEIENLPRIKLVSKMLGKEMDDLSAIKEAAGDETPAKDQVPLFEAEGLQSNTGIRPFDFHINKGEVNGFTGLLGSGRSECVRAIFGADRVVAGTVKKNGKPIKIRKPIDAMKQGIGYLPEDRKADGIIGDLSVRENIILASQVLKGFFKPYKKAEQYKLAKEYIDMLSVKTADEDTPIGSLSGGNQQKVIVARWLLTHPEYLILDEPTRGIDIGTKTDIQKLVLKLASEGMGVTFISSETDEMLRTCSRLIVMRDLKKVGELSGKDLNQSKIMSTIAGGESE